MTRLTPLPDGLNRSDRSDEPLWHFPLTEAWSDFIGPLQGTVLDKAECGPGRFITTIQMSLSGESLSKSDQTKSAISVASVQGYCDDGLLLPRQPSEGGPNDMFLVVSTEGFRDFVGAASETLETFMFVGQEHSNSSRFSLSCPRGLRMTGYQTRVTSVVLAIKFKCGKV